MKLYKAEMSNGRDIIIGDKNDLMLFLKANNSSTDRKAILTKGGVINPSFMVCITSKTISDSDISKYDLDMFEDISKEFIEIASDGKVKKLN